METSKVGMFSILILGCFMSTSNCQTVDQMDSIKIVLCPCPEMKPGIYCCSDIEHDCFPSREKCKQYCCNKKAFSLSAP
ncbi:hypothetical protein C2845_PM07G13080 [Panicum miliaceum]|uniref:WAP domain-containing protein n=1 Tax=Panicum miliaceum TaxID=4540 RepID=A0A3L6SMX7_PANMI|nr:hypothetical protein C2845_PM07G13080 [Panicum miliaceum]